MATETPLTIVSAGVVCSVGLSAPAACAAIRASLNSFKKTHFIDHIGQPIIGAAIPSGVLDLPGEEDSWTVGGDDRLAQMLTLAVGEAVRGAGDIDLTSSAIFLVGPEEERAALSGSGQKRCFDACVAALGAAPHEASRVLRIGSPGLVEALIHARQLLTSPKVQSVLIAGADSFLNPGDINDALSDDRLLVSGSSDGFIPGEAAACVLVTRGAEGDAACGRTLSITGLGMAQETEMLQAKLRSRGVGLSRAIQHALQEANIPAHAVHARHADVSAESYFFEESSYAWTRLLRGPAPRGYKLSIPVTRVGHVGAAMGPLILATALDDAREGRVPGPNTLVHLSSSGAFRGALVLLAS